MKKVINYIIQNLIIILAGIIIVFIILEDQNPTMKFIDSKITIVMMITQCILSIINAILKLKEN